MTCDLLVLNSNVTLVTAKFTTPRSVSVQGWRKLFITGQAKFNPEHYSINAWVANNSLLLISSFCQLHYNVIRLPGLKITLPLSFLLF